MYPQMMMPPFVQWLLTPVSQWHLASPLHKMFALAAGAGVAYYTRTRLEWSPAKVAAAGVGAAYAASLLSHTLGRGGLAALMGQQVPQGYAQPMMQPVQPPQALPQTTENAQPMGQVVDMRSRQPVAAVR